MLDQLFQLKEAPYTAADAEWDEFVGQHPQGSLLQTTAWGRLKSDFGWSPHRVWLRRDGQLVAGAQFLVKAAALGVIRIAYVPHGPLVDWQDDEQVAVLLNQIDLAAYSHRAGMLKMEPLLWQEAMSPADWAALCQRHDCLPDRDTIQPPRTLLVDLRPSPAEILANMKQKTRYNIRLAEKKGVTVRQGRADDLPLFTRLMQITGERDQFGIHQPAYYRTAYNLFAPRDEAALFIAEYEGQPLAALMAFAVGKVAAYLYGASSNAERQRMPTYAVQWAAIQWAKEKGCDWYDLWGVPDAPEAELELNFNDRSDGLWGVYRFKRGFGGQLRRTVGAADRPYNSLVYRLYQWRRNKNR
jgi:peptidoglycan pentaglycine glycine transferase (the first glycine)